MKKSYTIDYKSNDMRLDRWIRNHLGKIPQSLIEKSLRFGKIKVNNKKKKSSYKVKTSDQIVLYNFRVQLNIRLSIQMDTPAQETSDDVLVLDPN